MKTGLITSDTYQDHDTGPGHPEQIARVTVINENRVQKKEEQRKRIRKSNKYSILISEKNNWKN